jgi:hypothetical protein
MTARDGKADELVDAILSVTSDTSLAGLENCVVPLVARSASNEDVHP